jgi:hypothetical protein
MMAVIIRGERDTLRKSSGDLASMLNAGAGMTARARAMKSSISKWRPVF